MKYVAIRWFFAVYSIVFMSLSIWDYSVYDWMFALTSINYILCTIYFIYAAIHVTHSLIVIRAGESAKGTQSMVGTQHTSQSRSRIRNNVHWLLYTLSLGTCTFVFVAFWVMLAPYRKTGYTPTLHTFLLFDRHGINLVLIAIDFAVNKIPVRLLHFVYTTLLFGLYLVYNSIYWASTGKLMYGKTLDYGSSPGRVAGLAVGGGFVAIPLIQLGWYMLSLLKQSHMKEVQDANANVEFGDVC